MRTLLQSNAPAKLNLYLHITGKRADGYHLLESLVVFTDLVDAVAVAPSDGLSLMVNGPFASVSGDTNDNLVLRAARLLQTHTGTAHGAAITLTKNIPVGAGLGGGSADAAAALRALNVFWKLNLDDKTLLSLAPQLGADVPMCLVSKPLIARGVGEIIEPLAQPLPPLHAVLVYPGAKLLSKDVYGALIPPPIGGRLGGGLSDSMEFGSAPLLTSPRWGEELLNTIATTRNDLQPPAVALAPTVGELLRVMAAISPTPALVRMTGSGSCCFALFDDAISATNAARLLALQYPSYWARVVEIMQ